MSLISNYQSVVWPVVMPSETPFNFSSDIPTFGDELRAAVASSPTVFDPKPTVDQWFVEWWQNNIEKIKEKALQRAKIGGREITLSMISVSYPSEIPDGTGKFYSAKVKTELEKELGVKAEVGCWSNDYIDPFFTIKLSW
jgi:hypothetical protein